jgi:hypothetical protein
MTDTPIASHPDGWQLFERPPRPDSWRNYLLLAPEGVSPRRYHIGINTAERRLSWNKTCVASSADTPPFITGYYCLNSPSSSNTRPQPAASRKQEQ